MIGVGWIKRRKIYYVFYNPRNCHKQQPFLWQIGDMSFVDKPYRIIGTFRLYFQIFNLIKIILLNYLSRTWSQILTNKSGSGSSNMTPVFFLQKSQFNILLKYPYKTKTQRNLKKVEVKQGFSTLMKNGCHIRTPRPQFPHKRI
jgi:hypothetical protein